MNRIRRFSPHWFALSIALVSVLFMSVGAQAYTIRYRVWPANSTTYARAASFTNKGADWITSADVAVNNWSANFQFILNNASSNQLTANGVGANGYLGRMTPTNSGLYRTSFSININADRMWYAGPAPVPANRFDLRTILRHEFGHALGLDHSAAAGSLMRAIFAVTEVTLVDTDAINGAKFLYDPASNPPIPEGEGFESVVSAGTYDHNFAGFKGSAWIGSSGWPKAYLQTIAYSNGTQPGYQMWFTGDRITRRYTMASNRGTAAIYIDGVSVGSLNDNTALTRWQAMKTWTVSNGKHLIEVRGTSGSYTDLDAFIVNISASGAGNYDNINSTPFSYIGSWTQSSSFPSAYLGTISYTNATSDAVTFTFTGTSVKYYFAKAFNRGKAAIAIDGVDYGTVDLYSATTQWQQSVTYSGLGAGYHTIHISVSGQKNPSSTDYYIDVDRIDAIS